MLKKCLVIVLLTISILNAKMFKDALSDDIDLYDTYDIPYNREIAVKSLQNEYLLFETLIIEIYINHLKSLIKEIYTNEEQKNDFSEISRD